MVDTNNKTHKIDTCEKTLDGLVCGQGTSQYESCLLQHSVSICDWTVLPITYHMMIEIAPQYICMITPPPCTIGLHPSQDVYRMCPCYTGLQNYILSSLMLK
ncbi:hypothetical protein GDO78_021802 [Eleutherodactylus coqui]|uniref:Uncharacterized protein n=1 Tax=Eleutherodactylus coqui TaxID=57060 RepID=A0A8J6EH15_ELECQ|nr:hypothetical protein GDO78_021802 [Eleutherodactylus coqui]